MTYAQPPHLITALEDLDAPPPLVDDVDDLEAPARRQPGTLWRVEFEDGGQLEVRATNRDMIAWEKTKARHREWPTSEDAPVFATTFVVWNAARRAGLSVLTFDQFADAVADLTAVKDEPADPTR